MTKPLRPLKIREEGSSISTTEQVYFTNFYISAMSINFTNCFQMKTLNESQTVAKELATVSTSIRNVYEPNGASKYPREATV